MTAYPCPHCGRPMPRPNNKHQRLCLRNPEIYAATRAALDDGAGRIKAKEEYAALHPAGTLSASVLAKLLGSWAEVATYFGLTWSREQRPRWQDKRTTRQRTVVKWESIVAAMSAELDAVAAVAAANRYVGEGLTVCNQRVEGDRVYSLLR